jgi:hypothetical protein
MAARKYRDRRRWQRCGALPGSRIAANAAGSKDVPCPSCASKPMGGR